MSKEESGFSIADATSAILAAHKQEVEEARRELAIQVSKALFRNGIELNVASKVLADSGIPSALERSGE